MKSVVFNGTPISRSGCPECGRLPGLLCGRMDGGLSEMCEMLENYSAQECPSVQNVYVIFSTITEIVIVFFVMPQSLRPLKISA